ncbi:MAG TPA: HEAT repeat domain-containing protein, partial [Gemmatimonadota bacterium]|nr:HEAT repeat domain-containing protein [Gemmatimonadota bacterium]
MSFAARPEVCGNGENIVIRDSHHRRVRRDEDWEHDCEHGVVRIVLRIRDRQVDDIDVYVGGRWRAVDEPPLELGTRPVREAVDYLLDLARGGQPGVGPQSLFAASLADSVVIWPELLALAKDESLPGETRKMAILLTSEAAGDAATAGLTDVVYDDEGDLEVRKMAVFALSQRPADEAVPTLIQIVRTNPDPGLVRSAIFLLGQIEDPRVVELYEEILIRG